MKYLEDEIAMQTSREISNEIDREVLWSMLEELGWIRTGCYSKPHLAPDYKIQEVQDWVKENALGHYENYYTDFIFENSQDAVMFILKWS